MLRIDRLAKSLLANEIERSWKKIRDERSVKIRELFEGVSPSLAQSFTSCGILAEHPECAQNAHGASKIDFLRSRLYIGFQKYVLFTAIFTTGPNRNMFLRNALNPNVAYMIDRLFSTLM